MRRSVRQAEIAAAVEAGGRASVDALAAQFDVSLETMRRDLADLAAAGTIRRVHGAAVAAGGAREAPFTSRLVDNAAGKRAIAAKLAEIMRPGETIFIDTGTTTLTAAQAIAPTPDLTIVTNGAAIAAALARGPSRVFLLGGWYGVDADETYGAAAVAQIGEFQADRAILTAGGLDAELGVADFEFEEASVARAMAAHADSVIVLADATKFGRRAAHRVSPLDQIDMLLTDGATPPPQRSALNRAGVHVL